MANKKKHYKWFIPVLITISNVGLMYLVYQPILPLVREWALFLAIAALPFLPLKVTFTLDRLGSLSLPRQLALTMTLFSSFLIPPFIAHAHKYISTGLVTTVVLVFFFTGNTLSFLRTGIKTTSIILAVGFITSACCNYTLYQNNRIGKKHISTHSYIDHDTKTYHQFISSREHCMPTSNAWCYSLVHSTPNDDFLLFIRINVYENGQGDVAAEMAEHIGFKKYRFSQSRQKLNHKQLRDFQQLISHSGFWEFKEPFADLNWRSRLVGSYKQSVKTIQLLRSSSDNYVINGPKATFYLIALEMIKISGLRTQKEQIMI